MNKELTRTQKFLSIDDVQKAGDESIKLNLLDKGLMSAEKYDVYVLSNEVKKIPHVHLRAKDKSWEIEIDENGNIIGGKQPDDFLEIKKEYMDWLSSKVTQVHMNRTTNLDRLIVFYTLYRMENE
ncbi:MAG: hypothetical protein FWH18_10710 [Marinilabiliaceae bacterium]|nr:hypothetical protein [Marinilabiliaceae bacterium]